MMKKGFVPLLKEWDAHWLCLQETKLKEPQAPQELIPYPYQYYAEAEKAGYSGTAVFSKEEPLGVERPFCARAEHPAEGRVLALELPGFFLVNVYVPNAQDGLRRLDYRVGRFDEDFRVYLKKLAKQKPVVVCGDFNVAHQSIDLARPDANHQSAGFSDEERHSFGLLLKAGFQDIFRQQHPDEAHHYTWWSYRGGARARNVGWRIDYFLASEEAGALVGNMSILSEVLGSDHCPIALELQL